MRATTLLLIFGAFALGALAYIGYKAGVKAPELPSVSLPQTFNPFPGQTASGSDATVYKWRDGSGQWHYSGEPPPGGQAFEVVNIDTRANTVPGRPPEATETEEPEAAQNPEQETLPSVEMAKDLFKLIEGQQRGDTP